MRKFHEKYEAGGYVPALWEVSEKVNLIKSRFEPNLDEKNGDEYFVFYEVFARVYDKDYETDEIVSRGGYIASYRNRKEAELLKNWLCPEGGQYEDESFDVVIIERDDLWSRDDTEHLERYLRISAL